MPMFYDYEDLFDSDRAQLDYEPPQRYSGWVSLKPYHPMLSYPSKALAAFERGKHNAHHFTKDGFKATLNVEEFKPSEVTVTMLGRDIIVEGKHDERDDKHGTISRHFKRRFPLPKDYDWGSVQATLSEDGHLVLTAPPPKKPLEEEARVVPVQLVGPVKKAKSVEKMAK